MFYFILFLFRIVINKYSPDQNFTIKKKKEEWNVIQHNWKSEQFVKELKWLKPTETKMMGKGKGQL